MCEKQRTYDLGPDYMATSAAPPADNTISIFQDVKVVSSRVHLRF